MITTNKYINIMNNILFDLIPIQQGCNPTGSATYTQRVLLELLQKKPDDVRVYGLYDSRKKFIPHYNIDILIASNSIILVDIANTTISAIVSEYSIHTFFAPIAQFLAPYDIDNIQCRTIMLIHDIYDVENEASHIRMSIHDTHLESLKSYIKVLLKHIGNREKENVTKRYHNIISLYSQPNVISGTVSTYSGYALKYHFPSLTNKKIHVWFSPLKTPTLDSCINNPILKQHVENKEKYFLLISANRTYKNAKIAINAFLRFHENHSEYHLLLVNYTWEDTKNNIHRLSNLSDSDLEFAYKHAQALLFPSYFEGFGYPPVEALKYGVPTLASNVTSIPEVLGDAGFYFSPFYEADLYRLMVQLADSGLLKNTKSRMTKRYEYIKTRQEKDLESLVGMIIKP